jgi:N utilization substance protein B
VKNVKKDPRHRAREAALQILYQWEIGRTSVDKATETYFDLQWNDAQPPSDRLREFASSLASDTVRRLDEVDALIAGSAEHWRPERMAVIDRLILRIAVTEFLRDQDAPAAVVINEALELARTFSTEDAVKFINGMLDGIKRKMAGGAGGAGGAG